jgi:hypothetical protein
MELLRWWAMARDAVSVAIEPTVALPKHPIKTRQAEDRIEWPCPPDSPRHKEICIGPGSQLAIKAQYKDVIKQFLFRNFQSSIIVSGLQVLESKTPPLNYLLPEVNPTKAEPTSTIVKYPPHTRWHRVRFVGQFRQGSLLPLKTATGEPSAMNAELGVEYRIWPSSTPNRALALPSNLAVGLTHTRHGT